MNKKQTLALLAVLSLASAGCQKERIVEPPVQNMAENDDSACDIIYSVDGVAGRLTVRNASERLAFIRRMMSLAEEGHRVTFRQDGSTVNVLAPKDTQTFSSKKKSEVEAWAEEMFLLGYQVTIEFNEDTGMYIGTATNG